MAHRILQLARLVRSLRAQSGVVGRSVLTTIYGEPYHKPQLGRGLGAAHWVNGVLTVELRAQLDQDAPVKRPGEVIRVLKHTAFGSVISNAFGSVTRRGAAWS